jgi:hypothetical protein
MENDEHVFDYMAAAEETGRQLDLLIKQVPSHIKTATAVALVDEWKKVTAFKDLSEAIGKLNDVIDEVQDSVKQLRQTVWMVAIFGITVTIVISVLAKIIGS